ncbi:hypothetical protein QGM71_14225 [Virgibacillus sp. C22-A2]|uniref:Zinc-ribbon domain-containing protein n=1 Tax=Virgibacillus tibetensis TaxID=3042313 RepID=A0ABU6KHU7_9BACI|nr:hypothetical protein [Virgibacillus sp. C22-A2]
MICPNCGQHTENAKFCTNCGAVLSAESEAAAASQTEDSKVRPESLSGTETQQTTEKDQSKSNDTVDNLKSEVFKFGNYFFNTLKKPSEAHKSNGTNMISGIATMVIFSVLYALGIHLASREMSVIFQISFFDSFILPLLQFILLFALLAGLTFGGTKFAAQAVSFKDVLAKFGAYSVPFLVLSVIGGIFSVIGLPLAGTILILSLVGPLLLVPTFILLEQPAAGFDRIYVLLGIYIVSLIIAGFLVQNIFGVFMGGMMDGFLGSF